VEHLGDDSSCPPTYRARARAACRLHLRDADGDVAPSVLGPGAAGGELPRPLIDQLEGGLGLGARPDLLSAFEGDAVEPVSICLGCHLSRGSRGVATSSLLPRIPHASYRGTSAAGRRASLNVFAKLMAGLRPSSLQLQRGRRSSRSVWEGPPPPVPSPGTLPDDERGLSRLITIPGILAFFVLVHGLWLAIMYRIGA
jgi:hypothetical protein